MNPMPAPHDDHPHDHRVPCECEGPALALVPDNVATDRASGGSWGDAMTWTSVVPGSGSCVVIPDGITVTLDSETARLKWLRVDGTLELQAGAHLQVETIVPSFDGILRVGPGANVTFLDDGPIDRVYDPQSLSRGLLVIGKLIVEGTEKTAWEWLAANPKKGDTIITLAAPAKGWRVGDELVVAGVKFGQDEEVAVAGIGSGQAFDLEALRAQAAADRETLAKAQETLDAAEASLAVAQQGLLDAHAALLAAQQSLSGASDNFGDADAAGIVAMRAQEASAKALADAEALASESVKVTINKPLLYDHVPDHPDGKIAVGNLTRDVVFRSESKVLDRRAHVMLMQNPNSLKFCRFSDMGRTNKKVHINNFKLDANGALVPGTGTNQFGRYSVHFHQAGTDRAKPPAVVVGCVVSGDPGWGYVNHSGHIDFTGNIAHDVVGTGFVSEAGDEIGAFDYNLAIKTTGSGTNFTAGTRTRQTTQDFAHEGNGFWFQGSGISARNNVSFGARCHGFVYYGTGLILNGVETQFQSANLPDPSLAAGRPTVSVRSVAINNCSGNVACNCPIGLNCLYLGWAQLFSTQRSVVDNLSTWNNMRGVSLSYSSHLTLQNSHLLGNSSAFGVQEGPELLNDNSYINVRVDGARYGILLSERGSKTITGGSWTTTHLNFAINSYGGGGLRRITFSGLNVVSTPNNIGMTSLNVSTNLNLNNLFGRNIVTLDGRQVYSVEQAADYVPFQTGSPLVGLPTSIVNKTNQQLWDQYGIAIWGAVAPVDTVPLAGSANCLIGSAASYLPDIRLLSATTAPIRNAYRLGYFPPGSTAYVMDPTPVTLVAGWNAITRTIGGRLRTFFVKGT